MTSRVDGEAVEGRAALEALAADPRLGALGRHVPPLSLPRAFGVERDEVRHSRVLAELLDPGRHSGAGGLLRFLLREVSVRLGDGPCEDDRGGSGGIPAALGRIAGAPFGRISVRRESMFIDVVLEVSGPGGGVVIGIENKVDAGEQPEQIARYQATLARAYPGRAAAVVFLTPTGRAPATAVADSPVPAVALGYGWLWPTRWPEPGGGPQANAGEVRGVKARKKTTRMEDATGGCCWSWRST